MRSVRSLLFVPGHKADWIAKALASEADGIIIDLEDAVPAAAKAEAREHARAAILGYRGEKQLVVRVNGLATEHFAADAQAVAVPGLAAVLLPMLEQRDDVVGFDAVLAGAELAGGLPRGSIGVIASFETARSIVHAEEIVAAPRVVGIMAAAAKDADIAHSVGFTWSPEGLETLHLRSRLLLAARAAQLEVIVLGLWQEVRDLDGLRAFAEANAALGYRGQVLIHPSHAATVNEVYGLAPERIDYYRRLIAAFEAGVAAGSAAVAFEGEHIDLAHAQHARARLRAAGIPVADPGTEGTAS